jgi:hypothetical protein
MVEAVAKIPTGLTSLEPMPSQVIKARQDLTKVLQVKAAGKVSLYDHIVKVVDRIVQSCPDKALERFEEISYLIKNSNTVKLEEFVRCSDERQYAQHSADLASGTEASIEELR